MDQQLKLNKQQQLEFAERINQELEKIFISWDNTLKQWYPHAITALDFNSAVGLKIPRQEDFVKLFKKESQGLNMNIVTVLCNNLEERTPHQMGMPAEKWADVLLLNAEVGKIWNSFHLPVHQKVYKEFQIMANRPKMIIAPAVSE